MLDHSLKRLKPAPSAAETEARPRRGAIDAVPDLTRLDLPRLAEGHSYGHSGYVERGFTSDKDFYRGIVEAAGFDREETVLDVGCGFGRWSVFLGEVNASVTGIDPMDGRLIIARNLAARLELDNTTFARASSGDLPFAERSFDAAWCFSALHFVDRAETLDELHRVLVPGGRLFVGMYFSVGRMIALLCYAFQAGGWDHPDFDFAATALESGHTADGPPNYGTPSGIEEVLDAHGFAIERRFDIDAGRAAILSGEEIVMLHDPVALVRRFREEPEYRARLLADYPRLTRALDDNLSVLARRI
jgi:SAM-dependent methyltransferase